MVRFTDRAFAVATSTNPLLRAVRTGLVPRLLPLAVRVDRALAYGVRTIAQLGIGYRRSPAVQDGRPAPRRGPRAGDRLPDARVARDGQVCWLGEALAAPGALHDVDGRAFPRLGVEQTAHYLIRPDGHVGYRAAGTDLNGLRRHLSRWLPNPTPTLRLSNAAPASLLDVPTA